MKKKLIMLLAAFVVASNLLFAGSGATQVPESVTSSFNKNFSGAKQVSWDSLGAFYKVTFEQNGDWALAFYSTGGNFMGNGKNVLSDELPATLKKNISGHYQGYWISDLVKYDSGDKTGYMITIENADEKLTLNSVDSHRWQLSAREAK